jgi:hypothetical protein
VGQGELFWAPSGCFGGRRERVGRQWSGAGAARLGRGRLFGVIGRQEGVALEPIPVGIGRY